MRLSLRMGLPLVAACALGWIGGCSDGTKPAHDDDDTSGPIASDPLSFDALGTRLDLAHLSLPPGTITDGVVATLRSPRSTGTVTVPISNGGFDPVPIPASPGDEVTIEIERSLGPPTVLVMRVPVRRPPTVVRTIPQRGAPDVPLNTVIVIVFSEPIAPSTLAGSVQLLQGSAFVAGAIRPLGGMSTAVVFEPSAALEAHTTYHLVLTRAARDLTGDALSPPAPVEFTTGSNVLQGVNFVAVVPDTSAIAVGSQSQFTAIATNRDTSGAYLISGQPITWSSENPAVATVSASGLATGIAEGVARIRAEVAGHAGTAELLVTATQAPVDRVEVRPALLTIARTGIAELATVLTDATGNVLRFRPISWRSGNADVVGVSAVQGGRAQVSAASAGRVTITAASGGKEGTATIDVVIPGPYVRLAARGDATCGVTIDSWALCWGGDNGAGALGIGKLGAAAGPTAVAGALRLSRASPGGCGLDIDGVAYCWGSNDFGRLGIGDLNGPEVCQYGYCSVVPVPVSGGLRFAGLEAGYGHACGISSTGAAYCWGRNDVGQLGVGDAGGPAFCPTPYSEGRTCSRVPVPVAGGLTFTALVVGAVHTCALDSEGAAWCWGGNWAGQLGDGTTTDRAAPVRVAGELTFVALSAGGWDHTCGVASDGTAHCWGANRYGELGTGTIGPETCPAQLPQNSSEFPCSRVPAAVAGELTWTAIAAGSSHSCAVTEGGEAYCWGINYSGELGTGSRFGPEQCGVDLPCSRAPVAVTGDLRFSNITAGGNHSCAVTTAGVAFCWGYNASGQLGIGFGQYHPAPVRVDGQP